MTKIGVNGYGRIGKLVVDNLIRRGLPVVHINDPFVTPNSISYSSKYDSVYKLVNLVEEKDNYVSIAKGCDCKCKPTTTSNPIIITYEKDPEKIDWKKSGVDFVIDATGCFLTLESLKHNVNNVILTAPAKDDMQTLVFGVNHEEYSFKENEKSVISNASCTTNCLAPLLKLLEDKFGVDQALMTTVHSLTATQKTVDSLNKKKRLGRSSLVNIIPSTTGAAKCVTKVIPSLVNKVDGMAFRVPTISVSCVDLTVNLKKETNIQEIVKEVEELNSKIIRVSRDEIVSSDLIGDSYSCIVDEKASMALNSKFFKIVCWYDNEYAYAVRTVDLLCYVAKQRSVSFN